MNRGKAVAWLKAAVGGAIITASFVSCGGGDNVINGGGSTPPVVASKYLATSLVSDIATTATHADDNIVNPWGLAFHPTGYAWVANNGTSTASLFDGNGVAQNLVVSIPPGGEGDANPTGIVYNPTQDFQVTQNSVTGASQFIFAGEAGTIAGWSQAVNATEAVTVYDIGANGPVYKGLAIGRAAGANYLYAADFQGNKIDVFDHNFVRVDLVGDFRDPGLPAGYAPFGIQVVGDRVYVAYAQRAATAPDEVRGAGLGVVSVFSTSGAFIRQLTQGGALNAPWGMAVAPVNFGSLSNHLLVANFGDGKINAYNTSNGRFEGTLSRADGTPVVIDGLWGIAFGNGSFSQPLNTLFFTAGPSNETHGLFGRIDLQ
ncbi:MAG: hypothetical protein JWQ01_239 [Massilia sp.]|nr:hypothetical protein [Massilia sp.]